MLVGILLVTVLAMVAATHLTFDAGPRAVWSHDDDEQRFLDRFAAIFGSDDQQILIVLQAEDFFNPEAVGILRAMSQQVYDTPGIVAVYSIFDARRQGSLRIPLMPRTEAPVSRYDQARQAALQHPLVAKQLLSDDGRSMLLIAQLAEDRTTIQQLRTIVTAVRHVVVETTQDKPVTAIVTGPPPVAVDSLTAVQRDQVWFGALSAIVSIILAWILFHRAAAVFLVLSGPLIGVIWTIGMLGYSRTAMSGINSVVPTVIFVLGFANAVHLVFALQRNSNDDADGNGFVRRTILEVGPACAMAAATSAVGFASLSWARTPTVQAFGQICAAGTVLSILAVVITIPTLAMLLPSSSLVSKQRGWKLALINRRINIANFSSRYYRAITTSAIILAAVLSLFASRLRPEQRMVDVLPAKHNVLRGLQLVDAEFGGSAPVRIHFSWPSDQRLSDVSVLSAIQRVHDELANDTYFSEPISVLNLLQALASNTDQLSDQVPRLNRISKTQLDRLVRPATRELSISARVPDKSGVDTLAALDRLRDQCRQIEQEFPGLKLRITGHYAVAQRNLAQLIRDLAVSLLLASFVIFPWMAICFRSLRLAVICILPNLFPLVVSASLLVGMGIPLGISTTVTFSFCLGISVDDTIHFLMRYRQGIQSGLNKSEAILAAYQTVGTALVASTVVLLGGFSVLGISPLPPLRTFALLCCVCFTTALLADLVLLPAMLIWFDRNAER